MTTAKLTRMKALSTRASRGVVGKARPATPCRAGSLMMQAQPHLSSRRGSSRPKGAKEWKHLRRPPGEEGEERREAAKGLRAGALSVLGSLVRALAVGKAARAWLLGSGVHGKLGKLPKTMANENFWF